MNDATASLTQGNTLQNLAEMGGPVILVLLAMSVIGLTAALYSLVLTLRSAPRATARVQEATRLWSDGQGQAARSALTSCRNTMAELVSAAMDGRQQGRNEQNLREELARRVQRVIAPFEPPLKLMEVIAALAPLLGLLGTVLGMMTAFQVMASTAGQADPGQLSGGIYEALSTTAAGLIVAIPFAAIAALMEFRLRRQQEMLNDYLVRVLQAPVPGDLPDPSAQVGAEQTTPAAKADRPLYAAR
ncbi:MotA/TolQ/ExbB proton channel family protein [Marinimicrobium alkaliphilum]|uniref:MotA/TolQ/ExbB proton channel family protein n=1 Tax=Marinimicrobium alkaliphilum TaxID=2202654 RepID=UPI000DB98D26|nr:MotA/TolQ/ExbB proton channel family protein [Marinimicrobium alkaliphilum]